MDIIILDELKKMIALAIDTGLIPQNKYKEIEFNVLGNGQSISIEHWPNSDRADEEHSVVQIPVEIQDLFVFKNTVQTFK